MNEGVTDYIQNLKQAWQVDVCTKLRESVHQAIPDVEEKIQYSKPHFRKNGKYACVVSASKAGVSATIFNATDIEGPEGFFEAAGPPERKTIKINEGQTVDYALFTTLLQQASSTL